MANYLLLPGTLVGYIWECQHGGLPWKELWQYSCSSLKGRRKNKGLHFLLANAVVKSRITLLFFTKQYIYIYICVYKSRPLLHLKTLHFDMRTYFCLKLEKEVRAQGNVELWLGELLTLQQKSLHGVIREAAFVISEPTFELLKFIDEYIAQVMFLVLLIRYVFLGP